MTHRHFLVLVLACFIGASSVSGCAKKDTKEIQDLQAKLEKEARQTATCQDQAGKLQDRLVKLEAALKKIREQPCVYELDPVSLEVKKRRDAVAVASAGPAKGPPLDLSLVKSKIRSVRGTLKRCYEEAAKRDKSLAASSKTVSLRFTIYNSGKVGNIKLVPYVGGGFQPCVRRVVRTWKFPKFGGYPKNFVQRLHLTPK